MNTKPVDLYLPLPAGMRMLGQLPVYSIIEATNASEYDLVVSPAIPNMQCMRASMKFDDTKF